MLNRWFVPFGRWGLPIAHRALCCVSLSWSGDKFLRRDFCESNTGLRLTVKVNDLSFVAFPKRGVEITASELAIVYDKNTLKKVDS